MRIKLELIGVIKSHFYTLIYVLYFLFIYSGLIKWINLPFDITIVLGSILLPVMLLSLWRIRIRNAYVGLTVLAFLLFFIWYIASAAYTVSSSYYLEKIPRVLLSLIAFFFPFLTFNEKYHANITKAFKILSIAAISVLTAVYFSEQGFNILIYSNPDNELLKIPDYLAIGTFIGVSIIIFSRNISSVFSIVYLLIAFIYLILIAGRGPIFFIFPVLIFYFWKRFKPYLLKPKVVIMLVGVAILFYWGFTQWEGSNVLRDRLSVINKPQGNESLFERYNYFNRSLEMINERPIFGGGIGSFGILYFGRDIKEYPHNLFLEVLVESGVLGFIFFMIFVLYVLRCMRRMVKMELGLLYVAIVLYLVLNSLKSSGFEDSRIIFAWIGISIGYYNIAYNKQVNYSEEETHDWNYRLRSG